MHKSLGALDRAGLQRLVVAGGVGANTALRAGLEAACARRNWRVHYPELQSVHRQRRDDRAGRRHATRSGRADRRDRSYAFDVKPRWPLADLGGTGA